MEKEFVTYEIALKLKELGFDEEVCGIYRGSRLYPILGFERVNSIKYSVIAAPLWQQVIDWFRKQYDIVVEINHGLTLDVMPTFYYSIWKMNGAIEFQSDWNYITLKYEDAREQGILKTIDLFQKKLIKIQTL